MNFINVCESLEQFKYTDLSVNVKLIAVFWEFL